MATDAKKPAYLKYLFGGLSGMGATLFVQPLDLVKNRMQLQGAGGAKKEYANTFDALTKILKNEGVTGIYKGLGAGFLRQATYTTTRMGIYTGLNESYKAKFQTNPNLLASMGLGMVAGAAGAFVGTPAEVALIRMTADGRLPLAERRNYSGVFNALLRMTREEGVLTLWRGCIPTMGRAMVVNAAQLASYTQAKQYLVGTGYFTEGIKLHFVASMMSGFITTVASMPVDIAKTRLQNMKVSADGKSEYRGTVDVLSRVVRQEGLFALWKGFTPYFCRLGPHTVLTFIFLEQFNQAYNKYVLGTTGGSGL